MKEVQADVEFLEEQRREEVEDENEDEELGTAHYINQIDTYSKEVLMKTERKASADSINSELVREKSGQSLRDWDLSSAFSFFSNAHRKDSLMEAIDANSVNDNQKNYNFCEYKSLILSSPTRLKNKKYSLTNPLFKVKVYENENFSKKVVMKKIKDFNEKVDKQLVHRSLQSSPRQVQQPIGTRETSHAEVQGQGKEGQRVGIYT